MGCPAKKVCNVLAGSALLRDEGLVGRILAAVVGAVAVPVTLKIRTGWDTTHRNALRIAEAAGVQALAVHGRTRACMFGGRAEYETIAAVKAAVRIPAEIRRVLLSHLDDLYRFYGEHVGVPIARKHIGWHTKGLPDSAAFRHCAFQIPTAAEQRTAVDRFFALSAARPEPRVLPSRCAAALHLDLLEQPGRRRVLQHPVRATETGTGASSRATSPGGTRPSAR